MPVLYRRHAIMLSVVLALGWLLGAAVVLVLGWLSGAAVVALPLELSAPPLQEAPDPHLPALALESDVAPELAVGETTTITLTVANAAPDPADDLEVTMPVPAGALALPGPGYSGPTQGWRWTIGHLNGHAETIVTATLSLPSMPLGAALLLAPQATASGLGQPVLGHGGAPVSPRERGPARADFIPGAAAELHSRDGWVVVRVPAQAHRRRLTLQYTPLADKLPDLLARGTPIHPAIAGFKRGLGTFYLDAADVSGAAVHLFDAPLTISVAYTTQQLQALRIAEGNLTLAWFDEQQARWVPVPSTIDYATQTVSATVDHFSPWQLIDGSSGIRDLYSLAPGLAGQHLGPAVAMRGATTRRCTCTATTWVRSA